MLSIVTYNLNGIRAAIKKGLLDWINDSQFDIICLQEIKVAAEDRPQMDIEALGYSTYRNHAEKKGYSGVAILSKQKPDAVRLGCGIEKYDREGRILSLDFGDWTLINAYIPSGTSGEERHNFKMEFLKDFQVWIEELKKTRKKIILVGDYNIVHTRLDIHNPDRKDNPSGYRPEERKWMDEWMDNGFVDAFRYKNPETKAFSWWSQRAGSRGKNLGWRIDYQSVTSNLSDKIIESYHLPDVVHSDHAPVVVKYDL